MTNEEKLAKLVSVSGRDFWVDACPECGKAEVRIDSEGHAYGVCQCCDGHMTFPDACVREMRRSAGIMNWEAGPPTEPCPACRHAGAYCGGSKHPSCGCFEDGFAVSRTRGREHHRAEHRQDD